MTKFRRNLQEFKVKQHKDRKKEERKEMKKHKKRKYDVYHE